MPDSKESIFRDFFKMSENRAEKENFQVTYKIQAVEIKYYIENVINYCSHALQNMFLIDLKLDIINIMAAWFYVGTRPQLEAPD